MEVFYITLQKSNCFYINIQKLFQTFLVTECRYCLLWHQSYVCLSLINATFHRLKLCKILTIMYVKTICVLIIRVWKVDLECLYKRRNASGFMFALHFDFSPLIKQFHEFCRPGNIQFSYKNSLRKKIYKYCFGCLFCCLLFCGRNLKEILRQQS